MKISAGPVEEVKKQIPFVMYPQGHPPIVIFFTENAFYAVDALCPHENGPLKEGKLDRYTLTCPLHAWEFNIKTGECLFGEEGIQTYPTIIENNILYIQLP